MSNFLLEVPSEFFGYILVGVGVVGRNFVFVYNICKSCVMLVKVYYAETLKVF